MNQTNTQPLFFVYIIESPGAYDFLNERLEGFLIRQSLSLSKIPCLYKIAISKETFNYALTRGLIEGRTKFPKSWPILHFSAHGDDKGIGFSNGDFMNWEEFRDLLEPLNTAMNGNLIICLSCCQSSRATSMATHLKS